MKLRTHDEMVATARKWRDAGWTHRSIGDALGVSTNEAVQLVKESRECRGRYPEPNDLLIQLMTSAYRLKWTAQEEASANCYGPPQRVEIQQFMVEDGIRHAGIGAV